MNQQSRVEKARVAACVAFAATPNNLSQGVLDHAFYACGYWQYIDILVFWGGAAGEGLILAPNPHVTDAAHRHGVRVFGNVFFPEAGSGGRSCCVDAFLTRRADGSFPVADKLIEAARFYGFDGWFINQETDRSGDDQRHGEFRDFLAYASERKPDGFMWYELSGSLAEDNVRILQDGKTRVSDSIFLDYAWMSERRGDKRHTLRDSAATAEKAGRSGRDLYAGLETVQGRGDPEVAVKHVSLALFRPDHETMKASGNGRDLEKFHEGEATFWVGGRRDPSDVPQGTRWGLARYIVERTPVLRDPFVTHFNTGHGTAYYAQGKRVRTGGWANLSLQDVMPLYRWVVDPERAALKPRFDYEDAFEGGTSLLLLMPHEAARPSLLPLFQAQMRVTPQTEFSVVAKPDEEEWECLEIAVALKQAPQEFLRIRLEPQERINGWVRLRGTPDSTVSGTAVQLGLWVRPPVPAPIRLGQLSVLTAELAAPPAPTDLKIQQSIPLSLNRRALRLRWKPAAAGAPSSSPLRHYEVYRGEDRSVLLGATLNTCFYVESLERDRLEKETPLVVCAVGPTGHRSGVAKTVVEW
ncbi:hypothetical protein ACFFR8_28605 [Streptoalloteichus tenebrarius]